MTQQRLAEKAEVSHSLISALESGRRKYVSAQDIERLAKALDISSNDLWRLVPGGKSEQRYHTDHRYRERRDGQVRL